MIDYIDNFFDKKYYDSIVNYCLKAPYYFGEVDSPSTPPIGMIHDIPQAHPLYKLFQIEIDSKIELTKGLELHKMRINYFCPAENPYYHVDGSDGITCLYYLGPIKVMKQRWTNPTYNVDDGGETQFYLSDTESINILPIPNRMSFFDADILHRATSFRNDYRFTIAIKYR